MEMSKAGLAEIHAFQLLNDKTDLKGEKKLIKPFYVFLNVVKIIMLRHL